MPTRFTPPRMPEARKHPPPIPRKPAVVFQPQTHAYLQKGVDLIASAIRPTLGPLPRLVALEGLNTTDVPEFLDEGAIIARRIYQIMPRGCDVGAMLIRQALWKMHTEVGDGSTTMGIMYQSIVGEGVRYITQFGCNAMLLRKGLEKGLNAVREYLHQQAEPLMGKEAIAGIARGMCQEDHELAEMLAEIFDIVGTDGLIVVEGWEKWGLEREYIEGTYWKLSGWFSRHFLTNPAEEREVFEDTSILISDLKITEASLLVPVLEKCARAGIKKLVIVCKEISDSAIGLLVTNNQAKTVQTMAVRIPKVTEMDRLAAMQDIAVLTGGRIFQSAVSEDFEDFQVQDLGQARRAWAMESLFGIYGGKGDPRQIRKHILEAKGKLEQTDEEHDKAYLIERIGRLSGGTAILRVGGIHKTEREARKSMAERAVASIRVAIQGGIVPGGGSALLDSRLSLKDLPASNEDESLAYRILARALEEPMRAIAYNSGYVPDVVLEKAKSSPKGSGLNAVTGQIGDMRQMRIMDSVIILEKALEVAVSGAALALTTDVIVHHRKPKEDPLNP